MSSQATISSLTAALRLFHFCASDLQQLKSALKEEFKLLKVRGTEMKQTCEGVLSTMKSQKQGIPADGGQHRGEDGSCWRSFECVPRRRDAILERHWGAPYRGVQQSHQRLWSCSCTRPLPQSTRPRQRFAASRRYMSGKARKRQHRLSVTDHKGCLFLAFVSFVEKATSTIDNSEKAAPELQYHWRTQLHRSKECGATSLLRQGKDKAFDWGAHQPDQSNNDLQWFARKCAASTAAQFFPLFEKPFSHSFRCVHSYPHFADDCIHTSFQFLPGQMICISLPVQQILPFYSLPALSTNAVRVMFRGRLCETARSQARQRERESSDPGCLMWWVV